MCFFLVGIQHPSPFYLASLYSTVDRNPNNVMLKWPVADGVNKTYLLTWHCIQTTLLRQQTTLALTCFFHYIVLRWRAFSYNALISHTELSVFVFLLSPILSYRSLQSIERCMGDWQSWRLKCKIVFIKLVKLVLIEMQTSNITIGLRWVIS